MKEEHIVRYSRDKLPKDTRTDWARVDAMTEEEIDAAARSDPDAQPTDDAFWEDAVLVFPSKHLVCIRIDRDVLDWFRGQGRGYQTRMNAVLRSYMEAQVKGGRSNRK
jgi:uncharacterized protein (DUF4415 family)